MGPLLSDIFASEVKISPNNLNFIPYDKGAPQTNNHKKNQETRAFFVGLTGWTDDGLGVKRTPHLVHLTAFLSGISAAIFWAIVSWFLHYTRRQLCPDVLQTTACSLTASDPQFGQKVIPDALQNCLANLHIISYQFSFLV